jgi:hypothetical protein
MPIPKRMSGYQTSASQEQKQLRRFWYLQCNRNSNTFTDTSCASIRTVVNGEQLWLQVLRDQYNVYRKAESTDHVVVLRIWIHYSSSAWIYMWDRSTRRWCDQLGETGSAKKRHSTGRPRRPDEDANLVWQTFVRSLKKSNFRASAELQMLQTTVHRILRKSLRLKSYKLQVVQKLTAHDKQLTSQFAAHVSAHILEHDN